MQRGWLYLGVILLAWVGVCPALAGPVAPKIVDKIDIQLPARQRVSLSDMAAVAPLEARESPAALMRETLDALEAKTMKFDAAADSLRRAMLAVESVPTEPWFAEGVLELGQLLEKMEYTTAAYDCYAILSSLLRLNSSREDWLGSARLRPLLVEPERLMVRQGRLSITLGNFATGEELLHRARRYHLSNAAAVSGLLRIYFACREFPRAEKLLLSVARYDELAPLSCAAYRQLDRLEEDRKLLTRLARVLLKKDHLPGALAMEFLVVARRQRDRELGRELTDHILRHTAGEWDRYDPVVRQLHGLDECDAAMQLLVNSIEAKPATACFAADTLGELSLDSPDTLAGILLKPVATESPARQAIRHHLAGELYLLTGRHTRAEKQLRLAVAADPAYQAPYLPLVDLLAGRDAKGVEMILTAPEVKAMPAFFLHHLQGRRLMVLREPLLALRPLRKSMDANKAYLPTQIQLAECFVALISRAPRDDQKEELKRLAELALKKAITLELKRFSSYRTLLEFYLSTKQAEKAFDLALVMVRGFPSRVEAKALLGGVYLQRNQPDKARTILGVLQKQDRRHPAVVRFAEAVRQYATPTLPEVAPE